MASCRRTLVFPSPGRVEVREEPCPAPPPDEVLVEATVSAISAGTEMLVYRGHLPPGMPVDATIRGLGLRRMHQVVEREDTPAIRGMIHKVRHLVEVVK